MKVRFVIQYRSIKGNCEEWGHVWGTPEEWEPCWTDSDGHTFSDPNSARRVLSALLTSNFDFPPEEWRIVRRETVETVLTEDGA